MPVLKAILLGFIQGVTSLLPVSSSGHVVLISKLLGVDGSTSLKFLSLLHIGTLCAVCIRFRRDIRRLFKGFSEVLQDSIRNLRILIGNIRSPEKGDYRRVLNTVYGRFSIMLCISMIPSILAALGLRKLVEAQAANLLVTGIGFTVTALILFITSFSDRKNRQPSHTRFREAALIGIAQGISVFPGVSRVGMVMTCTEFLGFSKKYVVKYTMLLGIPAMLGAVIAEAFSTGVSLADTVGIGSCIAGVLTAAVISWFMLRIAEKLLTVQANRIFAVYSLLMGIASVAVYMN
ncbi:MAG: undecaprenyl-diphosphate phosphatase [Eubacteriales bacterium]|nr:undecaprenyl-diphosphate phosphatase [Eubacteriales bacterium]